MPRYLFQINYVGQGAQGLLKEGGTNRRAVADGLAKQLGGVLESFYYAFGETDAYAIVEFPDNCAAATLALKVNASLAATIKTTVLLTPEEVDAAANVTLNYRAPGQ